MSPSTLFGIGSITKFFSAALTSTLSRDGKLSWDQPIRSYLPRLNGAAGRSPGDVTLRDLRSNRSSLPSHDFLLRYSDMSRREIAERLQHLWAPDGTPGAFRYSNLGSLMACHISERIAELDWNHALDQRVLQPLGLRETVTSLPNSAVARPYAHDHAGDVREIPHFLGEATGPASGLYSSISDMARLLCWITGDRGLPHSVVSHAEWEQMTRPHVRVMQTPGLNPILDPEFGSLHHGLGLMVTTYRGSRLVLASGHTDGFAALMAALPEHGLGVGVLCNLDGSVLPTCLGWQILDLLLGVEPGDWSNRLNAREVQHLRESNGTRRYAAPGNQHDLAQYAGLYSNPGYGAVRLLQNGGRPAILLQPTEVWPANDSSGPVRRHAVSLEPDMDIDPDVRT